MTNKPIKSHLTVRTKIGMITIEATDQGICSVLLDPSRSESSTNQNPTPQQKKHLKNAELQLDEYFNSKRKQFDLPFDLSGTPFQKSVWNQLAKIPYGTTCSYQDIAVKIKNKKAYRAVGTANGKNPICILIPCHRVIAADGSIGGYSGGIGVKKKLLMIEQSLRK
jgi:methylated-DNA-[protein]-cysteine S-methyltransferase